MTKFTISRRSLLKTSAVAGAGIAAPMVWSRPASAYTNEPTGGTVTLGTGGVSAFPQEAKAVEWSAFFPACAPQVFGRDTLIVLDKEGD